MKRSAVQCVAGAVGATLIVVGVVWTCRQLSSPTRLNAAPVVPESSLAAAPSASSLKLSTASTATPSTPENRIRSTSGSQLSLSLLGDSDEAGGAPAPAPAVADPAPLDADFASSDAPAPAPLAAFAAQDAPLESFDAEFPNSAEPFPAFESNVSPSDAASAEPLVATSRPLESQTSASVPFESSPLEPAPLVESPAPLAPLAAPSTLNVEPSQGPSEPELSSAPVAETSSNAAAFEPRSTRFVASRTDEPDASSSASAPIASEPAPAASASVGRGVPGESALEGPQTTQIVVEKVSPKEIQVGTETTFVVSVKNLGTATAREIVLRDALPAGATFASAEPSVSPTAQGELVWPAFDLEPQREKSFEYRLIPMQEGEIGSVATVVFGALASCKTRCVRPELQVEASAPSEATIGENIDLEIVVSNVGSGAATEVALLETIPDGLYHPSGSVLNNELGTLKPGESKRLPLTLQCAAAGATVNKLVVTAKGGIEKQVETEIKVLAPSLELSIEGSANPYLERPSLYRLKVKNVGDAPAKDVKLVAEIPDGTEFVDANNLGAYKDDVRSVYWDLAELPVAAEGEIELTLKPTKIATSQLTFGGTGPNQLSAQVVQDVAIDGMPALSFDVKTTNDPVEVGKEIEYEIQLINRGTKASTNALLQAAFPATMQVVSTDGPSRPTDRGGTLVFDKIREIPAKSSVSFKVKATASEAGDCRVGFQVSSDDLEPLVKEENTRVYR